jgi:hypothetical protein
MDDQRGMMTALPPNDAVGRKIEIDALRAILSGLTETDSHQYQECEESSGKPAHHRRVRRADGATSGFNGEGSLPFDNHRAPRILVGVPCALR